jgi:hypothetical protein
MTMYSLIVILYLIYFGSDENELSLHHLVKRWESPVKRYSRCRSVRMRNTLLAITFS